jgi:hypothetical protein
MKNRVRAGLTCLAALAVVAAGCGGDDTGAPETTTPPAGEAATDSAGDAVAWADSVCVAADDLRSSVDALGTSLQVDITGEGDALTQLRDQLVDQVQAVTDDTTALAEALAAVPAGPDDPDLLAARDDLEGSREDLQVAVDELATSVQSLSESAGAADLVSGVAEVTTAFVAVQAGLSAFAEDVAQVADAGGQAVRAAFEQAPACASTGLVDAS